MSASTMMGEYRLEEGFGGKNIAEVGVIESVISLRRLQDVHHS
jgi:hypothetical protein